MIYDVLERKLSIFLSLMYYFFIGSAITIFIRHVSIQREKNTNSYSNRNKLHLKGLFCGGRILSITSSKSAIFFINSISCNSILYNFISGGAAFSYVPPIFETGFKKKSFKTILIFLIKKTFKR